PVGSHSAWYLGTEIPHPEAPVASVDDESIFSGYHPATYYNRLVLLKGRYADKKPDTTELSFVKFLLELPFLSRDILNWYCIWRRGLDLYHTLQDPSPRTCISNVHVNTIVKALIDGPLNFDVELLHSALSGAGANEMVLIEVLLNRPHEELGLLKTAYLKTYGRELIDHLKEQGSKSLSSDLKTFTMLIFALKLERDPRSLIVDNAAVKSDVDFLVQALERKSDDGWHQFIEVFVNRSQRHLAAGITEFGQRPPRTSLSRAIKGSNPSGFEAALLFILHGCKAKRDGKGILRDAKLIEKTMAGLGTRDNVLVYRLIRAHWDATRFSAIRTAYRVRYGKRLVTRIAGDTSGIYRDALLLL
ncbi:hypothetical protein BKA70DRAFT_1072724, partial [Coprinopsis sp. MPI-PUGE-AT-0042]